MDVKPVACLACKKRKKRCDRRSPCSSCAELGVECIPGVRATYRYRKRRNPSGRDFGSNEQPALRAYNRAESTVIDGKEGASLWSCISQGLSGSESEQNGYSERDRDFSNPSPFLNPFCVFTINPASGTDLQELESLPVDRSALWEMFLTNVDPLSKVIHIPSAECFVTKALDAMDPSQLALVLAIHTAAVVSMSKNQCMGVFGHSREHIIVSYVQATQAALVAAGIMKTHSLIVLQGFVIYLLSTRSFYDSQSFFLLTGMAIRLGQRLGLHLSSVASNTCRGPVETEIGIRIWWQILIMDSRSTQVSRAQVQPISVAPGYPLPSDISDTRAGESSTSHSDTSKTGAGSMVFCLVRYEIGLFFAANAVKLRSPNSSIEEKDSLIDEIQDRLESKYLQYCDTAIPLHLFAIGSAHSAICKMRLMTHHPTQYPDNGASLPKAEKDMLFELSLKMIDYDVLGYTNDCLSKFQWHMETYFQLDAFVFMLVESCNQDPGSQVDTAWQLVPEVFKYHPELLSDSSKQLHIELWKLTVEAWSARLAMLKKHKLPGVTAPPVVLKLQENLSERHRLQNAASHPSSATKVSFQKGISPGPSDPGKSTFDSGLATEEDLLDWDHWVNLV